MGDDTIRALFESLESEPRPEFIAQLRRRVEHELLPEAAAGAAHESSEPSVSFDLDEVGDPDRGGRQPRRRWTVAVVIGAAAAMLAVFMVVVRSGDDVTLVDTPATPAATTVVPSVAATTTVMPAVEELGGRLRATIPVENTADSIAVTDDAVWVSGWDGSKVSRIDAASNEVITVDVGADGTQVVAGDGGVWVGVDGGRLLRLDPDSAEVIATIEIAAVSGGGSAPQPVIGDAAVWVHEPVSGVLSQVDSGVQRGERHHRSGCGRGRRRGGDGHRRRVDLAEHV